MEYDYSPYHLHPRPPPGPAHRTPTLPCTFPLTFRSQGPLTAPEPPPQRPRRPPELHTQPPRALDTTVPLRPMSMPRLGSPPLWSALIRTRCALRAGFLLNHCKASDGGQTVGRVFLLRPGRLLVEAVRGKNAMGWDTSDTGSKGRTPLPHHSSSCLGLHSIARKVQPSV